MGNKTWFSAYLLCFPFLSFDCNNSISQTPFLLAFSLCVCYYIFFCKILQKEQYLFEIASYYLCNIYIFFLNPVYPKLSQVSTHMLSSLIIRNVSWAPNQTLTESSTVSFVSSTKKLQTIKPKLKCQINSHYVSWSMNAFHRAITLPSDANTGQNNPWQERDMRRERCLIFTFLQNN